MHRRYEVTLASEFGEFTLEVSTKFGQISAERMARNQLLKHWAIGDAVVIPELTKDLGPDTQRRDCATGSCPIPGRAAPTDKGTP